MRNPTRAACGILGAFIASVALAQTGASPNVRETALRSPAVADNLLGDPAEVPVAVYLPPGYDGSDARYPVLYLLHGIADSHEVWTKNWKIPQLLDRLIAAKKIGPMIVVMPTSRSRLLGTYYVNSPVTGRWEDFLAVELVAHVDKTYRTRPGAAGRGVAGHSMGGFGAINLAMKRSDVFGSVYAMSPCCLDAIEDIGYGNQAAWQGAISFRSYEDADAALKKGQFYPVAAFGLVSALLPDPAAPLHVRLPIKSVNGELLPDEPLYTKWLEQFPVRTAVKYRESLRKLRALRLDYGFDDQFADIPGATARFSAVLSDNRIPHALDAYAGDHRGKVVERLEKIVFPFFSQLFAQD